MNRTALAALTAALLTAGAARADSLTLHGDRLTFTSATADDATIATDSSLTNSVRVNAEDPSCLTTREGAEITVDSSACGENLGHVTIDVPQGFRLTVNIQNSGNVSIGNTGGDLSANVSSNGDLHAGRVGSLFLVVTGSGDASVQSVNGAANLTSAGNGDIKIPELNGLLHSRQSGSGDLAIGQIVAPAVDISQNGGGDAVIGKGSIDALRAQLSGSGDLAVAATVVTADLNASGGGDIHIAKVTGLVSRHASDGSSISTSGYSFTGPLIGKLAQVATVDGQDGTTINVDDGTGTVTIHKGHHSGGSGFTHFLAGALVLFLIFVVWRAVQRRGGMATVSSQIRGRTGGTATHPGVIAVRDKLAELEAKLARVETYVTNREFDLHRKFRELDPH
jgi:hypothetical protein